MTTTESERRNDPYQSDDDHPTLSYVTAKGTLALPYHLVRELRFDSAARQIRIGYDDYNVAVSGANLNRLWKELRAFRVKEIAINAGEAGKALGPESGKCLVNGIRIEQKADPVPGEEA